MTRKEWSGIVATTRSWAMVSRQAESADGGVDFELRFREPYSWLITETQPQRWLEIGLSEGRP